MKTLVLMVSWIVLNRSLAFKASSCKKWKQHSSILQLSSESTPWNSPTVAERVSTRKRNNNARFRQHVNPLARQYQQPTVLSDDWPQDSFTNCHKPLHLDIGCGKGGFLIDMIKKTMNEQSICSEQEQLEQQSSLPYNYLGLEIRPGVALYAKQRIPAHGAVGVLDYIGCNANVDLERILDRYHGGDVTTDVLLHRVSIQFPDPHFKSQHAKRRVVTPALVDTLAKYMPPSCQVFLQSDIQSVLDDMRIRFRESVYFDDTLDSVEDYLQDNPWGVPTEREISVLNKDLPVYRTILTRNDEAYAPELDQSNQTNED